MAAKPYIDYKFIGVRPFTASLEEAHADYRIFENDDFSPLYAQFNEILRQGKDTVRTGVIISGAQMAYFAEIGIQITEHYLTYIVFLFNHHPLIGELGMIVQGLESLVLNNLDKVDIQKLADILSKSRGRPS